MSELSELMVAFSKEMEEVEKKFDLDPKFPLEISGVEARGFGIRSGGMDGKTGDWVSIRPVAHEYEGKTFLGIYLGSLTIDAVYRVERATGQLQIMPHTNPAIYIPDLKKIVFGMESWWGQIEGPDDLKKITDQDIQNVWYVKAMKDLQDAEQRPTLDSEAKDN